MEDCAHHLGSYVANNRLTSTGPESFSDPEFTPHDDVEVDLLFAITQGDDACRDVYADYLEQHGSALQAEFVRVETMRSELPHGARRSELTTQLEEIRRRVPRTWADQIERWEPYDVWRVVEANPAPVRPAMPRPVPLIEPPPLRQTRAPVLNKRRVLDAVPSLRRSILDRAIWMVLLGVVMVLGYFVIHQWWTHMTDPRPHRSPEGREPVSAYQRGSDSGGGTPSHPARMDAIRTIGITAASGLASAACARRPGGSTITGTSRS